MTFCVYSQGKTCRWLDYSFEGAESARGLDDKLQAIASAVKEKAAKSHKSLTEKQAEFAKVFGE